MQHLSIGHQHVLAAAVHNACDKMLKLEVLFLEIGYTRVQATKQAVLLQHVCATQTC